MKRALVLATLLASTFLTTAAFADTISVHGSTTFVAAVLEPNKAAIEKDSGLTLDIVGNGSGNGLSNLAQGKADVAMISNKLEDVAAKVNAKTPGAVDAAALQAVEVTKTHIAFTVNPANPVKELTHAQIVDILTGKITSWKQVGGEDKAILVATEVPTGGLRTTVEKDMLGGAQISANKREVVNGTMIGKVVAQAPEALGVMGAGSVTAAVRELKLDKVDEIELYYVTKGAPSPAAQKLIDATKKNVK
ncbi:substrate-binding domain-containing protein [Propionivibrio sp.]|uniref:substrate-binding domain-containing protein n=1 Tax=Propionivibrio sp. TaxID=2212460 RepID=UPI002608835B|nr:substrate-binding domain-containing protein [Propionivibrio sp.]